MSDHDTPKVMLAPTSEHAAGEDFTDAMGRRWVATKVYPKEISVAEAEKARRTANDYRPPEPDPRTLSREELAEKLRPRRLVGDHEYRLEEPDYEVADRILATDATPSTEFSLGSESAFARARNVIETRNIIGGDDRQRVFDTRHFPGSANARLIPNDATATMIGPSTAVCAAHVFYNNGWLRSDSITFGADTGGFAPFGSFLADSLTIPGQWNDDEWDWDFAVLEFSPRRPRLGDQTGWFGTEQSFNGVKHCIGYPRWDHLPANAPAGSSWFKFGAFTASPGSRYEHYLDVIPGDSGAGIYDPATIRVNAIQSTQWWIGSRIWNEGRRWDLTTYNFFDAYGNWPRD